MAPSRRRFVRRINQYVYEVREIIQANGQTFKAGSKAWCYKDLPAAVTDAADRASPKEVEWCS